jgi:hypothetical protein
MIFTFEPLGLLSINSWIVRYFDFAASSFAFAESEASNEATVTAWFSAPEARTFPGTTTTAALSVFLLMVLKLTITRWLRVLAR